MTAGGLERGWGTWAVDSVLTHVCLPESHAISIGIKELRNGQILSHALVGRRNAEAEVVRVGTRSTDGAYTELELEWRSIKVKVESAAQGDELVILVTPLAGQMLPARLYIEGSVLWGRPGWVKAEGQGLEFNTGRRISIQGVPVADPYLMARGPAVAVELAADPVVISTDPSLTVSEAREVLDRAKAAVEQRWGKYGEARELAEAMHTCLAWDTVYDPLKERFISPVSRLWCAGHGGYVLFCWDTFFAAWMALSESPELAFTNAKAILQEAVPDGFVPNYAYSTGQASRDRSQPQVGSMTVREIAVQTGRMDFAEECFGALLKWNRWWEAKRAWNDCICPGSGQFVPTHGNFWEYEGVAGRFGAALETGLDNSPMYDEVPFDTQRELLCLADVGLTALYVADCQALRDLAHRLGHEEAAEELLLREKRFSKGLESLWNEAVGLYLNRRMDSGAWDHRMSPTNFYPMIAGHPSPERARRMVMQHLLNPKEFWGEHVIPSISRSEPAYADQWYWRGRIWAPMNFLVYLGLRRYEPEAAFDLARKSEALLLQEWREERHIHENYHAETGDGDDVDSSDAFYHWGALLALLALMDRGLVKVVEPPEPARMG